MWSHAGWRLEWANVEMLDMSSKTQAALMTKRQAGLKHNKNM